jgi:hypothetical protein
MSYPNQWFGHKVLRHPFKKKYIKKKLQDSHNYWIRILIFRINFFLLVKHLLDIKKTYNWLSARGMFPRRFVEKRLCQVSPIWGSHLEIWKNLSVNPLIKRFISKAIRSGASCESKVTLINTVNLGHPKWLPGAIQICQNNFFLLKPRIILRQSWSFGSIVIICWVCDSAFPN